MSGAVPPDGWTPATLDDLADIIRGITFPASAKQETPARDAVACLRTTNVQETVEMDDLLFVPTAYVKRPDQWLVDGDILVSMANSYELVGKVALARRPPERMTFGGFLAVLRPRSIVPGFLFYQLRSPDVRAALRRTASTTVNISNISMRGIRPLGVQLAPVPEQQRIVDTVESYLTRLDEAVAGLERVQRNLERYRASVLQAAVEGRLVATEAALARAEGRDFEPASVLLQRILAERRRRWAEAELAKLKARGKPPKDARWKAKYEEPTAPDTNRLSELPEGWCWASWSQIGFSQNGRGFPADEYQQTGARLLRAGNLHASGRIVWTEANTRRLPKRWADEYPGFLLGSGELVMNLTAQSLTDEFLGRTCLTGEGEACLLNQRIARLTPVLADPHYLLWMFKSRHFRKFANGLNRGGLIQHMFTSQLIDFPVPLPPLPEQARIAARVEQLLSVADAAEASAKANTVRCDAARQAILKWAFEGKLVDQDPTDEPASALLERIKAERVDAQGPLGRSVRPRRRRSRIAEP